MMNQTVNSKERKSLNGFKLEIPALSENEAFARQVICAFAARLDPTIEELSDLRVVVSEAVTNCVVHAYKGIGIGNIQITVRISRSGLLKVRIKDTGCGITDIERCMQPLYTTDPEGERGGMGLPIMQSLSRKFAVKSKPGKGTTVSFEMQFGNSAI
jgi:stage II sporulation protein AB (anti-sigma F factor)